MYNYSTHALEDMRALLSSVQRPEVVCGVEMRAPEHLVAPLEPLCGLLAEAPKFALPNNGDLLMGDWGRVLEMATDEYLRLPFPSVAMEFPFSDVTRMAQDRILIPKRIVLALEYEHYKDTYFGRAAERGVHGRGDLDGAVLLVPVYRTDLWLPYPFFAVVSPKRGGCYSGLVYSGGDGGRIESSVGYTVVPIGGYSDSMIAEHGPKKAYGIALSDVAEEVFVLLALTVALSCSNVGVVDSPSPDKLNKKRTKNGKLPFFGYKQIVIRPTGESRRGDASNSSSGRQAPRLHHRRGHIRNLDGGAKRVWVRPAMVGDGTRGVIHSDYTII